MILMTSYPLLYKTVESLKFVVAQLLWILPRPQIYILNELQNTVFTYQ